jgi:hypothetical protein
MHFGTCNAIVQKLFCITIYWFLHGCGKETLLANKLVSCFRICILHATANSVEHSPTWETNSHLASQDITRLSCDTKVHYRVHKGQTLVPILSPMNPVHKFPSYFAKIDPNTVLQFTMDF